MKNIGILLLCLLFLNSAHADLPNPAKDPDMWDAQATVASGLPPYFAAEVWGGWSYLVKVVRFDRSQALTRKLDRYSYSFFRPNLRVVSSIFVNRIQPRLDVYPLSFLGITVGHTFVTRTSLGGDTFKGFTRYDCEKVSCNGWADSSFLELKFKYGYNRYFGVFTISSDWIETSGDTSQSYDTDTGLLVDNSGDRNIHLWWLNGVKVDADSSVGLRLRRVSWSGSKMFKFEPSILYTHSFNDKWSVGSETGITLRSDGFRQGFSNVKLTYTFLDGPEPEG